MVDSALLLVDAFEGVMPQTKYVLNLSNAVKTNCRKSIKSTGQIADRTSFEYDF